MIKYKKEWLNIYEVNVNFLLIFKILMTSG